ncbi:MAG TPA: RluA family pseudouridine synthase [Burkholderiaceae bacterium]|jgi:23S rRNA pseudouridine955/2504/2580 synthase|nr:RluA family pseudouridine synthase [Burkholderiaceae bacterium]
MGVERKAGAARPAAVRYVTVDAESAGQRLDNFLIRLSKGVPKSHIYQVVRSGQVRINRGRAAADRRLAAGDEIRIPPMRVSARASATPPAAPSMLPVVFEDEHLLVVDKPAGMAAHGGSGISFGVIERIRAARPEQAFLELAHRLDRGTSGLLVLGKSRRALLQLHAMLRQGQVEKHYLALVAGRWLNDRQHVKLALSRGGAGAAGKVRVDPDGGAASHTVFELRERFKQFALLDAELRTGRTHQIRVHLAHIGFPIVGDEKYGNFELNHRVSRGEFGPRLGRMFLHACQVRLPHPASGEPIVFASPLPPDCEAFLRDLRSA